MAITRKRDLMSFSRPSKDSRTIKHFMVMTYLDVINQFWREHKHVYFSSSEIAFYFFIANECNRNSWNMPVACPTEYACNQLKLSKQGIMNARQTLAKRGLIDYDKGKRGTKAPCCR